MDGRQYLTYLSLGRRTAGDKQVEFTRVTASWVFTSAKNGAEADAMCQECRFAALACCEHMTYREFIEAILRCALILFPPGGMSFHEIDMAPTSSFSNVDRTAAQGTLKKLVPHKWNLGNASFHPRTTPAASRNHLRSFSAEPLLETSFRHLSPRSPTRCDAFPIPNSWANGKLSPIRQKLKGLRFSRSVSSACSVGVNFFLLSCPSS